MDILSVFTVVSLVLSILSVGVGLCAIYQAKKYNDTTGKILQDNGYIMSQQIRLSNELQKCLTEMNRDPAKVRLTKDKIILHKLSSYRRTDVEKAMDVILRLSIKQKFKDSIRAFLQSEENDYECNFWGQASGDIPIEEIYYSLLKCNIVVSVSYL